MNKFKLIMKQLFSVVLICSFVLPSFASISSADGSVFVTKGEFDTTINSLNTRLSTFEASINSKIDFQVSSYLERNGIWSGQEQILGGTLSSSFKAATTATMGGTSGVYTIANNVYIDKISKSGMLIGSWKWYGTARVNNNDTRWGWTFSPGAGTQRSGSGFLLYTTIEEYQNAVKINDPYTKIFLYTIGAHDIDSSGDGSGTFFVPISKDDVVIPFSFFVQKNSQLKWLVKLSYHFPNGASPRTESTNVITVQFLEATVY